MLSTDKISTMADVISIPYRCCVFLACSLSKSNHVIDDRRHIGWAIQLHLTNAILICKNNFLDACETEKNWHK